MNSSFRVIFLALTVSLMNTGIAFASGGTCSNFAGGSCPSSIPTGVTSFYFIDYAKGNDINSGTSESSPWQHAPDMANATGNAASHSSSAGEGWIFKGGVTVDYHAWPASVPWGGTASNPTYIGSDPGWYVGSAWSRPIFNGGGSTGYDTTTLGFLADVTHHTSYFVIDNIEFTGLYFSGTTSSFSAACYVCSYYQGTGADVGWEAKNLYVHGWSHGPSANDPAGNNGGFISLSANATPGQQSSFHDSIIDGADSSKDCCEGSGAAIQYNNYYSYMVDNPYNYGLTTNGLVIFHDNHMTQNVIGFTGGPHENCFHSYAYNGTATGGTIILYNNFDDCKYAGTSAEPMAFELVGATVYAFNNVIAAGNPDGISNSSWASSSAGTTIYEFNNTIYAYDAMTTAASACYAIGYKNIATFADNFCITNNNNSNSYLTFSPYTGTLNFPSPSFSITCSGGSQSNFGASQICAPIGTGDGTGYLNSTETYPFAPMDSTAATTIGTGQNNSAYCAAVSAINAAAGTACLSDTTLGVSYNTSGHTVNYPYRAPVARPTGTTAWRNGAYELGTGQLNPPTGLSAIVN